jgi:hypothetical protein
MPADDDNTLLPFSLPSICQKKVTAAFDGGLISSDGGMLLLAGADKPLGVVDTLAAIIPDHRDPAQVSHSISDILRARILAIAGACPCEGGGLPGRRRPGRSAQGPRLQTCLRPATGKRRRPGLAADDIAVGERTGSAHPDPADVRHGGRVVQQLLASTQDYHT